MTTLADVWQAGIDAAVADNTLNRGGFADAMRTVATTGVSNAEATAFIDAVAAEFNRGNVINNPTYNNLRSHIIDDAVAHKALFDALSTIGQLPEAAPIRDGLELQDLREERDSIDAAIDRLNVLIAAEPNGVTGRLVKDVMQQGKQALRGEKQNIRNQIQQLTGDPDS